MVILTHARQLRLSPPPPPPLTTIIFDPTSLSLALMHSDSSFSLYPHFSPFSPPINIIIPPSTPTFVSPPSSAATFLHIRSNDVVRLIFLVSSPHLAGSSILLRFYMLRTDNQFVRVRVVCNQSDLMFDEGKVGVIVKGNHGVSVKLASAINVFAMYSVSDRKVRVFAVKVVGDVVKLMRTAVIDCDLPVFSIGVSNGFLMLGEEGGVRVFNLRLLVKGRVVKSEKTKGRKVSLVNGMVVGSNGSSVLYAKKVNGSLDEKIGKHYDNSGLWIPVTIDIGSYIIIAKLKPVKMRQNSQEGGVRFVSFKGKELDDCKASKVPLEMSIKAISIQFLGHNKFLILNSVGELYLLSLSNYVSGSESVHEMKKLTLSMKVQNLAVLPDDSTSPQIVWVSDGQYTIHAIIVTDTTDSTANENDTKDIEEKIQRPATQVIFTSEKIQEIIPLSANAILLLGQANNIFAYAIS
ncbi:hypothetical protein M8C21_009902 [Ambrosia artemisiifolia]|uniref:Uncharacterized protein n=1 Tax=Ambrosia artemisiifolia TaxID=4212 RepID=A0AAD5CVB9_AMBAR|nr:hypothetical protein M8C21_009902 [Ambrosia artemisiifolia]